MSIFTKAKKNFNGIIPADRPLKISVKIKVTRDGDYNQPTDVAGIDIDQKLLVTSSAKEGAIKKEVESVVSEAFEKANRMIEVSNLLSDGQVEEEIAL